MEERRTGWADRRRRAGEVGVALGLTAVSTVLWGVAHLWAGRRAAGTFLMSVYGLLVSAVILLVLALRGHLAQVAVQHAWLDRIALGVLVLALVQAAVVVRSYLVLEPAGLPVGARIAAGVVVTTLAMAVCAPLLWTARDAYVLRSTLTGIFAGHSVDAHDPWRHRQRVNVLLLGGDGGPDRSGVRTDSITVASVDTRTGDSVLLSLPRNLQYFEMPPRLRPRFPYGYTGFGRGDQGLINELYQNAENNPSIVPGYGRGRRGPRLMEETVGNLLGLRIDYYVVVNLSGFADIVDAMGGLRVHVTSRLPIGGNASRPPSGYLEPGYRRLSGRQALWYGRSRHADNDYARMGRQKCLLRAMSQQADPKRVLARFEQVAAAAKKTISTDIPAELLPAMMTLADKAKAGSDIHSLMFVPPAFPVVRPSTARMRAGTARALAASARPTKSEKSKKSAKPAGPPPAHPEARSAGNSAPAPSRPVSLKDACR